eukprot:Gb_40516 [translate_table: standard]
MFVNSKWNSKGVKQIHEFAHSRDREKHSCGIRGIRAPVTAHSWQRNFSRCSWCVSAGVRKSVAHLWWSWLGEGGAGVSESGVFCGRPGETPGAQEKIEADNREAAPVGSWQSFFRACCPVSRGGVTSEKFRRGGIRWSSTRGRSWSNKWSVAEKTVAVKPGAVEPHEDQKKERDPVFAGFAGVFLQRGGHRSEEEDPGKGEQQESGRNRGKIDRSGHRSRAQAAAAEF